MPRLNGTGPRGQGALTGRGLGRCGEGQGYIDAGIGRGLGRGFGWKRFWGYYPATNPTKKEEESMLIEEAGLLEEELKTIKERLTQLKGQK